MKNYLIRVMVFQKHITSHFANHVVSSKQVLFFIWTNLKKFTRSIITLPAKKEHAIPGSGRGFFSLFCTDFGLLLTEISRSLQGRVPRDCWTSVVTRVGAFDSTDKTVIMQTDWNLMRGPQKLRSEEHTSELQSPTNL